MDWQTLVVTLVVSLATGYLLRQTRQTWGRRSRGCGGSCSCGSGTSQPQSADGLIPPDQLTLRRPDIGTL